MPHMFQGQMFLTTHSFEALKRVGPIHGREEALAHLTKLSGEKPSEVKARSSFRWQVESSEASDAIYRALIAETLVRAPTALKGEIQNCQSVVYLQHQPKLAQALLAKLPSTLRASGVFENFVSIFAEFEEFAQGHPESYLYLFPGFVESDEDDEFNEYLEAEHGALVEFFDQVTHWDGSAASAPELEILEGEDPLILHFILHFVEAHLKHRGISNADFANRLSAYRKDSLDLDSPAAQEELASYQEWFSESHQLSDFFAEPMGFLRAIIHKLSFD